MAITIGLDPGHGGSSSGTYSINSTKDGLFEEHYTLEVALLVEKILNEHGFKTVLIKDLFGKRKGGDARQGRMQFLFKITL